MIDIIVPVYNGEKTIKRCIDSIIKNIDSKNTKIIIVNDGSIDGTMEIVNSLEKEHPCITVYSKENGGVSSARQYGIMKSSSEYVMFVDSDDIVINPIFYPSGISKNSDLIVLNDNIDSSYFDCIDDKFDFIKGILCMDSVHYGNLKLNVVWLKIFKRSILKKYNIKFHDSVFHGEDMLFNLDYFMHCKSVYFAKKNIYKKIDTIGSITQRYDPNIISNDLNFYNVLDTYHLSSISSEYEYLRKLMLFNSLCIILNKYLLHRENKNSIIANYRILNKLVSAEPFITVKEISFKDLSEKKKVILFVIKHNLCILLFAFNGIIKLFR